MESGESIVTVIDIVNAVSQLQNRNQALSVGGSATSAVDFAAVLNALRATATATAAVGPTAVTAAPVTAAPLALPQADQSATSAPATPAAAAAVPSVGGCLCGGH